MDCISEYIMQFSSDQRERLFQIKEIIESCDPTLTKKISWSMPTYQKNGVNIIHFSQEKYHIGIHVGSDCMQHFLNDLANYSHTKSTLHIKEQQEIPKELIEKMVYYNEE